MMNIARTFLFVFFALLFSPGMADAEPNQTLSLGSGTFVEILSLVPSQLPLPQGGASLMVDYQTSIAHGDALPLRREVNEVWDRLALDIDRQGYQQAVINVLPPNNTEYNGTRAYNFVFEKKAGSWRIVDLQKEVPSRLDSSFIKNFLGTVDWAYEYNEMNAVLLYLADDWTGKFTKGSAAARTLDRMQWTADTHKILSETKDFHHQRDVGTITISSDGNSAQVESDEIEEGTINNVPRQTAKHSTDTIEIRNGVPLITKTVTFIQDVGETN